MTIDYALLACGPGGGLMLIIYGVIAFWIVSGGFFLANLCLLFALRDGPLLRHAAGLLLYASSALVAYSHLQSSGDNGFFLLVCALGLPAVVIGHFLWLVCLVRQERRALQAEAQPS
jgi:hypothetical protein